MAEAHYYEVDVTWKHDRLGEMSSPVLTDAIEVATPPEFSKGIPNIWSPEHLLVAAVNSCLMTTFLAIAENSRYDLVDFRSSAQGKLEIVDGKYMISEIVLRPTVAVTDIENKEKGLRLLQKAESACLISNSIRSRIIFEPEIAITSVKS